MIVTGQECNREIDRQQEDQNITGITGGTTDLNKGYQVLGTGMHQNMLFVSTVE